jgi:hypothetical protein
MQNNKFPMLIIAVQNEQITKQIRNAKGRLFYQVFQKYKKTEKTVLKTACRESLPEAYTG